MCLAAETPELLSKRIETLNAILVVLHRNDTDRVSVIRARQAARLHHQVRKRVAAIAAISLSAGWLDMNRTTKEAR